MDAYLPEIQEAIAIVNEIKGVEVRIERLDDVTLKDIAHYNIEDADIKQLENMGLMITSGAEDADFISLKMSIEALESNGMTCNSE